MKSFREIFNQTLAEAQAGRLPGSKSPKVSPFEQSPYILKGKFSPIVDKKLEKTPAANVRDKAPKADRTRVLTKTQKQALEFFRSYGEMLDDQAGTAEIKKAFRKLAKKLHPDGIFKGDPAMLKRRAYEFQQLHRAYRDLVH